MNRGKDVKRGFNFYLKWYNEDIKNLFILWIYNVIFNIYIKVV